MMPRHVLTYQALALTMLAGMCCSPEREETVAPSPRPRAHVPPTPSGPFPPWCRTPAARERWARRLHRAVPLTLANPIELFSSQNTSDLIPPRLSRTKPLPT